MNLRMRVVTQGGLSLQRVRRSIDQPHLQQEEQKTKKTRTKVTGRDTKKYVGTGVRQQQREEARCLRSEPGKGVYITQERAKE